MDARGQESNLGLSADGMVVDFGYEQGAKAAPASTSRRSR